MTYEFKAARVREDGSREDCIVTMTAWGGSDGEDWHISEFKAETFQDAIDSARRALRGIVTHITVERRDDWTGDPSLFFMVILRDDAAQNDSLMGVVTRVEDLIRPIANRFEPDLHVYCNYRSDSEQRKLDEREHAK